MTNNPDNNYSRFAANAGSIFSPFQRVVSSRAWRTWVKMPTCSLGRLVASRAGLKPGNSPASEGNDVPKSSKPVWSRSVLSNSPLGSAKWAGGSSTAIAPIHRNPPVIDDVIWQRLQRLDSDSPGFMTALIDLFLRDAEIRMHTLKDVLASRQVEIIERETRALKSGCLQVGARGMVELCEALLSATTTPTLAWADIVYGYLTEEFHRVHDILHKK